MCGIAGFWLRQGIGAERGHRWLEGINRALVHRGPDEEGFFLEGGVGLANRRLSILDFRTRTDTEVLVHLYEEYGEAMASRLRGMFAFALYDRFFASEVRALLALPFFPREIAPEAVAFYVALNYIPAPWTIWKHARRPLPGHWMGIQDGKIRRIQDYREWNPGRPSALIDEAVERLDALLRDSIRAHLLSDVPLGTFLSGGLDSSLVTALAQQASETPIRTFTVTFPEWPTYNEAEYARTVARHLGTRHEEIPMTAKEAQEILWEVVQHLDEPFADFSLINVGLISKVARQYVKVVLSGDGGDELLAGYNKYQGLVLAQWLAPWRWALSPLQYFAWREYRGGWVGERLRQARKLLSLLHPQPFHRYLRATLQTDIKTVNRVLNGQYPVPSKVIERFFRSFWWQAVQQYPQDPINVWLWMDTQIVLPYDMLRKVDIASMQYSLEVRVPFVDNRVAHFLFSLPGN